MTSAQNRNRLGLVADNDPPYPRLFDPDARLIAVDELDPGLF
jgi:hypothetical protein